MASVTQSRSSRPSHDRLARTRLAYKVLRSLADTGGFITDAEFAKRVGWSVRTVRSYRGKKWRDWIEAGSGQAWRVSQAFRTVTEEAFLRHQTQRTDFYASYQTRSIHDHVVTYEFLLPLTKEHELKKALDDLFYRDALEERVKEVGPDAFGIAPSQASERSEDESIRAIIDFMDDHFGGYSVAHVSGRFRSEALADRTQAGAMLTEGQRYLVDETTAVVRFIVPLRQSSQDYQDDRKFLLAISEQEQVSLSESVRTEVGTGPESVLPAVRRGGRAHREGRGPGVAPRVGAREPPLCVGEGLGPGRRGQVGDCCWLRPAARLMVK